MNPQDLRRRLDDARQLPYGPARVAAFESVRDRADAESPDSLIPFEARYELIYSAIMNGERTKSFVAFSWCLAAFDKESERYGRFADEMLWAFKWQPEGLVQYPEVPLQRTEAVLADMQRRYRAGGHGMHAVLDKRLTVALHLGDHDGAADLWRRWEITPRDRLSDCAGCVPSSQVAYLVETGQLEEAVRRAEPVLQGTLTCHEQPKGILTQLLPAYVATGRHQAAADAHRKAYQRMRSDRNDLSKIGRHLEFLSRTGNQHSALSLVEAHLPWLDAPPSPGQAMTFAAFASLALGRLDPTTQVRAEGRPTAGVLSRELAAQAHDIAAQFDARNGSTVVSQRVDSWITAEPWVEELPLNDVARRRRHARERPREPRPRPVEHVPAPTGATVDELLDHLEHRIRAQDSDGAAEAIVRVESGADRLSAIQAARVVDANARLLAPKDLAAAVELWREALPGVASDATLSRRVRARMGRALSLLGQVDEAVLVGEEPLLWLVDHDEPTRRSGWAVSLALVLLSAGRGIEALAFTRRALEDQDVEPAARRLHAEALWAAGKPDEAASAFRAAVEAVSRSDAEEEAALRWRWGALLREAGDPTGTVEQLVEVVALLDSAGTDSSGAQFELAWAYLHDGRPAEAAELGEDLARVLGEPDSGVEYLLAGCYEALDEPELALAHLRTHADLIEVDDVGSSRRGEIAVRRGRLLASVSRPDEALEAFRVADAAFADEADVDSRVPVLRQAARAAATSGLDADAAALRELADALTTELTADARAFHLGGLAWDVAREEADRGRTAAAIESLQIAETHYQELGRPEPLADCVLFRADLGDAVAPDEIRPLFEAADEHSDHWYSLGYALVETLPEDGPEARAIVKRLESEDEDEE